MINGGILISVVTKYNEMKKENKKVIDFQLITW